MRLRQLVPLDELGQPEVGDPDVPSGVQQEVRGLDVAVDHPLFVGVVQRVGDLGAEAGDLADIDRLGLASKRGVGRPSSAVGGVEGRPIGPGPGARRRARGRRVGLRDHRRVRLGDDESRTSIRELSQKQTAADDG